MVRFVRQALSPEALRERQTVVEQVKEVMSLPGWKQREQTVGAIVEQTGTDAARPPTDQETPFQRYYRLGFSHGVRAVADVAQRLVSMNTLSEQERSRLAMAGKMEVVK